MRMNRERLGPYHILELIGEGAMGTVFRAEHQVLGREVALKVLHPRQTGHTEDAGRFRREMKIACGLNHPNLVRCYDGGTIDGVDYLAMELLSGETLDRCLARERSLPWRRCARIAQGIADALAYLHGQRILHRDLKPSNVQLGPDGTVRVLDLGLAFRADSTRITEDGDFVGTILFAAPEVVQGGGATSGSDLWSLGCVLFQMLTGAHPFPASSIQQAVQQILEAPVMLPVSLERELPGPLCGLVRDLLVRDATHRLDSAERVRHRLGSLLSEARSGPAGAGSPRTSRPPHGWPPPPCRPEPVSPSATPRRIASGPRPEPALGRVDVLAASPRPHARSTAFLVAVAIALVVWAIGPRIGRPRQGLVISGSTTISTASPGPAPARLPGALNPRVSPGMLSP
ncbi:MAG: serine/threonine protein kinase [Candidatus Riflebacteria bacterium]|nr:serine/threonine protein kinase [Candidatus Riflebacteria bacterium]